jgi:hypothetical protein
MSYTFCTSENHTGGNLADVGGHNPRLTFLSPKQYTELFVVFKVWCQNVSNM